MSAPTAVLERAHEQAVVDGVSVVTHFGDPAAEYEAARHGVGLAHRGFRAVVRIGGADRARFLQGLLTNNLEDFPPGDGRPALFLDTKGHVRAVLDLWAEEDAVVVGCDRGVVTAVLPDLAKYVLAADVSIDDQEGRETVIAIHGAGAAETLERAGVAVPTGAPRAHLGAALAGAAIRVARTPDLGGPGFEIHAPSSSVDDVWTALENAADPVVPSYVGWRVAETLRIESGVSRFGYEISGAEFPQEALLDDAVDYEKGCYLGQETVARIHYRGRVNRLLSGLRADAPLPVGADLVLSEQRVGRVTSAVDSPRLGAIGLGYVRRDESEAGAQVDVVVAGERLAAARVVALPFDD